MSETLKQFQTLRLIHSMGNRVVKIYSTYGYYMPTEVSKINDKNICQVVEIDPEDDIENEYHSYFTAKVMDLPIIYNSYLNYALSVLDNFLDDMDNKELSTYFSDMFYQLIQMDIILYGSGENTRNAFEELFNQLYEEPETSKIKLDILSEHLNLYNPGSKYEECPEAIHQLELNHL